MYVVLGWRASLQKIFLSVQAVCACGSAAFYVSDSLLAVPILGQEVSTRLILYELERIVVCHQKPVTTVQMFPRTPI